MKLFSIYREASVHATSKSRPGRPHARRCGRRPGRVGAGRRAGSRVPEGAGAGGRAGAHRRRRRRARPRGRPADQRILLAQAHLAARTVTARAEGAGAPRSQAKRSSDTGGLLHPLRGSEHGHRAVRPEHLDEDVVSAFVLRNERGVGVSDPGDALLAGDEDRVELGPGSLLIVTHDVEADDTRLGGRAPGDGAGTLAERAREADEDVDDRLLTGALVDEAVAVVVEAVADLLSAGGNRRVRVVAVPGALAEAVPVVVVAI